MQKGARKSPGEERRLDLSGPRLGGGVGVRRLEPVRLRVALLRSRKAAGGRKHSSTLVGSSKVVKARKQSRGEMRRVGDTSQDEQKRSTPQPPRSESYRLVRSPRRMMLINSARGGQGAGWALPRPRGRAARLHGEGRLPIHLVGRDVHEPLHAADHAAALQQHVGAVDVVLPGKPANRASGEAGERLGAARGGRERARDPAANTRADGWRSGNEDGCREPAPW